LLFPKQRLLLEQQNTKANGKLMVFINASISSQVHPSTTGHESDPGQIGELTLSESAVRSWLKRKPPDKIYVQQLERVLKVVKRCVV
jgi:hypothetical protein